MILFDKMISNLLCPTEESHTGLGHEGEVFLIGKKVCGYANTYEYYVLISASILCISL